MYTLNLKSNNHGFRLENNPLYPKGRFCYSFNIVPLSTCNFPSIFISPGWPTGTYNYLFPDILYSIQGRDNSLASFINNQLHCKGLAALITGLSMKSTAIKITEPGHKTETNGDNRHGNICKPTSFSAPVNNLVNFKFSHHCNNSAMTQYGTMHWDMYSL